MILGTSVLPCVKSKPRGERTPGGIAGKIKMYAVIRGMPLAGGGGRRKGKLLKSLCVAMLNHIGQFTSPILKKALLSMKSTQCPSNVSVKYDVHWIREMAIPIKKLISP